MIPNIKEKVQQSINEKGHTEIDNRLKRTTRAQNGCQIIHHYLEQSTKMPDLQEKYKPDWKRMYMTYVDRCEMLTLDPLTRRAVIFNTAKYYEVFPCFLMMQVLHREENSFDLIIFQRSADLDKLEDDIAFFEFVMAKVSKRAGIKVDRLIINYGSIHYATEG